VTAAVHPHDVPRDPDPPGLRDPRVGEPVRIRDLFGLRDDLVRVAEAAA
jgi:hypothetical protein